MAERLHNAAGAPAGRGPGGPGPVERAAPRFARPFVALARLDQPVGVWLLLWPCLWAIGLASDGLPNIGLLALFTAGAFVMRAAGCTLNDIFDRDFDARVERTRRRPLPSGAIGVKGAVVFMAVLLGGGARDPAPAQPVRDPAGGGLAASGGALPLDEAYHLLAASLSWTYV